MYIASLRAVCARPMRHAVILAGGSGTRLWSMSKTREPKQLLPLIKGRSLLALAFCPTMSRYDSGLASYHHRLALFRRGKSERSCNRSRKYPSFRCYSQEEIWAVSRSRQRICAAVSLPQSHRYGRVLAYTPAERVLEPPLLVAWTEQ